MENYDFKTVENEILDYWNKNNIYAKVKAKRAGGKSYYFLDGPPYTSGKVHVGTAWNKSLKDMTLRFKRSQGFNVWDRAGYDMHGLPTENATEKKLGLHGKEEIREYGVDKFIAECKQLCVDNMLVMNDDFKRMGVWMDFDNAYQSIKDEFIEGEWWLVKKAHENGRLYEGLKTMTWCPDCATALAKHECEYQDVIDTSIFVKFKIKDTSNDFLVIWTTTPWTIPFNLAVMAGPDIDYVKVKLTNTKSKEKETWIVAEELLESVLEAAELKLEDVEVLKKVKGSELEGLKYEHPFKLEDYKELAEKHEKLHSVILSKEYVDTSAGSGLVHCAPGCGPEDYEVGIKNGLPAYNNIDEHGTFPESMNEFAGKVAKTHDAFFIEALEKCGALISKKQYAHDYAHCWRCKNPVIFRTTKQWFFKIEDLKPKLIEENNKISWVPKAAYNAFDSWLNNLRDNSITKQRFWGTPIPVWKCENENCGHYEVIGDKKELKKFAGKLPEDLHKPFIDKITWNCPKCETSSLMKRIPDILDVWVDAGTTSWNCLDFPKDEKKFNELFPADFILEGKDQIRGWFNLLHIASMISMNKPSFKNCYMHGFVNDSQGRKMSKSVGNYILPAEVIDKYGADTMRYYMIGASAPGLDMSYNMDDVEVKHRNLFVIWNTAKYLLQQIDTPVKLLNQKDLKNKELQEEELYILSRLNSTIKLVTEKISNYELNEIPWLIEKLFLDLSREYVKNVRDKTTNESGKELVVQVAGRVFLEALKLFSAVSPMISEKIYLEIKDSLFLEKESISFFDFPTIEESLINESIEKEFTTALDLVGAIFSARDSSRLGVRWPSAKVLLQTKDEEVKKIAKNFESLIKRQANIKELAPGAPEFSFEIKLNFRTTGTSFGQETAEIATYVKENMPKVQKDFNEAFNQDEEPENFEVGNWQMKKEHFNFTKVIEEGWSLGEFNKGSVYLYTVLDDDLEAEGFTREIIRRMQQLRKEAKLSKSDKVDFAFSGELTEIVTNNKEDISNIVGASEINILEDENHHLELKKTEKVKGKEFTISLKKI